MASPASITMTIAANGTRSIGQPTVSGVPMPKSPGGNPDDAEQAGKIRRHHVEHLLAE